MYKFLRSLLFLLGPETAHYFSMNMLKFFCRIGLKGLIMKMFKPPGANLSREVFGLRFPNPVGLGAGFDKNAKYLRELGSLGFGFVEIGTVTPKAQPGNDKPRLFRLTKDQALINRMGFNNDGVNEITNRLRKWKEMNKSSLIVGGNIGKNKLTPNEHAWKDYEICFNKLHEYVDYFVVNVSSPNTPGLRELQEKESLKKILTHLQQLNKARSTIKPILLKISPDLSIDQVNDIIFLAREINLDGLVVSNTTVSRNNLKTPVDKLEKIGEGGLSGLPLKGKNDELVQYIASKTNNQIPIIASGGIYNGIDAKEKIGKGAHLVQVWTGFIYEGPGIIKKICRHLEK